MVGDNGDERDDAVDNGGWRVKMKITPSNDGKNVDNEQEKEAAAKFRRQDVS